jgi:hypothetical protein
LDEFKHGVFEHWVQDRASIEYNSFFYGMGFGDLTLIYERFGKMCHDYETDGMEMYTYNLLRTVLVKGK